MVNQTIMYIYVGLGYNMDWYRPGFCELVLSFAKTSSAIGFFFPFMEKISWDLKDLVPFDKQKSVILYWLKWLTKRVSATARTVFFLNSCLYL